MQTYPLFWSAEGETAVLALAHDACLPDGTTSIAQVDLDPLTAQILVEKDERQFSVSEWPDPAEPEILLVDAAGQSWTLDINTGQLTQ